MTTIIEFGKAGEKVTVVASEVIAVSKYQSNVQVHLTSGAELNINETYETARNKLTSYIEEQVFSATKGGNEDDE